MREADDAVDGAVTSPPPAEAADDGGNTDAGDGGAVTSPPATAGPAGRSRDHPGGGGLARLWHRLTGGPTDGDDDEPGHVARAELVLARDDSQPLRQLGLRPDPLAGFARAMEHLDARESASVAVDLLPLTPGQRRRHRRRLQHAASDARPSRLHGVVDEVRVGAGHPRRRRATTSRAHAAAAGSGVGSRRRRTDGWAAEARSMWGVTTRLARWPSSARRMPACVRWLSWSGAESGAQRLDGPRVGRRPQSAAGR